MKKEGHPPYQEVLFVDESSKDKWICRSTYQTDERETFEGTEYPVCRVAVSGYSHPAYTGSQQFVDTEGRIDKFRKKYQRGKKSSKPDQPSA